MSIHGAQRTLSRRRLAAVALLQLDLQLFSESRIPLPYSWETELKETLVPLFWSQRCTVGKLVLSPSCVSMRATKC